DNRLHDGPSTGNFSDNHDEIRRQPGHQHRQSLTQMVSHSIQSVAGFDVALFPQPQNVVERWLGRVSSGAPPIVSRDLISIIAHGGDVVSQHFPASFVAAAAAGTMQHLGYMPKFPGHASGAPNQLA